LQDTPFSKGKKSWFPFCVCSFQIIPLIKTASSDPGEARKKEGLPNTEAVKNRIDSAVDFQSRFQHCSKPCSVLQKHSIRFSWHTIYISDMFIGEGFESTKKNIV